MKAVELVEGIVEMGNSNGEGIRRSDRCPFRIFPPQEREPGLPSSSAGHRIQLDSGSKT